MAQERPGSNTESRESGKSPLGRLRVLSVSGHCRTTTVDVEIIKERTNYGKLKENEFTIWVIYLVPSRLLIAD